MASGEYPKADGEVYYGKDTNMAYYQGALAGTLNHASVDISTSAEVIKAANSSRKSILIYNNGSAVIYIGLSGVTTGTGWKLNSGDSLFLYNQEDIYGITSSGTADIRYLEAQ